MNLQGGQIYRYIDELEYVVSVFDETVVFVSDDVWHFGYEYCHIELFKNVVNDSREILLTDIFVE